MAKGSPLVCQHAEKLSRAFLVKYQRIIRDYVRQRHGVYALYRKGKLHYVGLARNLRSRLKGHLRDRHGESWDRFSVYLTIGDSHIKELESLILRMASPAGNRMSGKLARSEDLRKRLARDIREMQRIELGDLIGRRRQTEPVARRQQRKVGRVPVLARYLDKPTKLRARYRGKIVRARVRRDGSVRVASDLYNSPSLAASAITKRPMNGWTFWTFERAPGDWVPLNELRR
jgi:Restriction Enzyme Adenine Methylase Associated